jgi:hypothetical protein
LSADANDIPEKENPVRLAEARSSIAIDMLGRLLLALQGNTSCQA